MSSNIPVEKFIPGSDADSEDIFRYPFTVDDSTINYLRGHGRIMFIIRGPAGTGKESLAAMLSSHDRYPNGAICCADNYFRNTFTSKKRDFNSLKQSHEYCRRNVESACQKENHPIIVKNTHIKKRELQEYLNLAAKYHYTIIMISTKDKFVISPEILSQSNTKGLNVEYFTSRLKQWQDIFPTLVGWFMSPKDSLYFLNELQTSLVSLLGDGKFCRVFNIFDNETLLEHYDAKELLYCVAACSKKNNVFDLKSYYTSDNVIKHYGQCFTLVIQGFLVTASNILAIVHLDKVMKNLHQKSTFRTEFSKDPVDTLDFQSLEISSTVNNQNFKNYSRTYPLNGKFCSSGKTAVLEEWDDDENIDICSCSCIHLARSKSATKALPWDVKMNFHKMLSSVANVNGVISSDQFGELEGGYRYCRLLENAWLLKYPYKISFKSVFTGMYV